MARRTCPQCKRVTGASSKDCAGCGHVFAAVMVTAPTARSKRCMMCGIVNHRSVKRCDCGYYFDEDPAELREFALDRRRSGWALLIGSVALGVVGTLLIIGAQAALGLVSIKLTVVGLGAVIPASIAGTRKGSRIVHASNATLDDIAGTSNVVPVAKLER